MRISSLELRNFRNHESVQLTFPAGSTTIIGRNGRGKTNILEAINYLAILGSHRVSQDYPLVQTGWEAADIHAVVEKHHRKADIQITIKTQGANVVVLNRTKLQRARDVLGIVHAVVFAPEDLELVKGDPVSRRNFIDEFCTQYRPRTDAQRIDFEKVLKQRNALLKTAGRRKLTEQAQATLEVWNEQFVMAGAKVAMARVQGLELLRPWITEHGATISAGTEPLDVCYSSKWLSAGVNSEEDVAQQLRQAINMRQSEELERGTTLVGPHRDDLAIELSNVPAKGYASHGQSWSIALALRLATFSQLRLADDDPILLLDDVFAELDTRRRDRLLQAIAGVEQTIITAAVKEDVPISLLSNAIHLED